MPSTTPEYDLLFVGNAIVDVLATVSTELLAELGAAPGSMTLIDAPKMAQIEQRIRVEQVAGGGSAANSAVVAARMGTKTAYLGKVAADRAGEDFTADMKKQGIAFPSSPLVGDGSIPTARCIVLITPDGQRTMFTYLGACVEFTPQDVVADVVAGSAITYLEGYLFDRPQAQEAFYTAARLAHEAGRQVSLTLSDSFCIQRHQAAFRSFVAESVDILFANEGEILALYGTENLDEALKALFADVALGVVTRGEKGAIVQAGETRHEVPTEPVKVVDTTGAGDAFAAGFLAGYSRKRSLVECATLGNRAAGHVIARLGGRPDEGFALKA
ncbi:adenosine kinase [Bombella sp. TMW 2.2559]|uniref:Adenosine kinase n=1 Tax=Bombella dulcis TaxID=2967339 RepID=A0ABT3WCV7_9PROT|nr:adenosine kinase [Bombella dulcis]MCX5616881.1 adenosine kinase [Bombella dulcis]